MDDQPHILITGGAGYIGSYLTGELLRLGYFVTVVDELLYGGESLLAYRSHPALHFVKADVWEPRTIKSAVRSDWPIPLADIHLAGIVGFPACQSVGRQVAWRYNGDMRDISVSFEKIEKTLNFDAKFSVDDGVREVLQALRYGLVRNPQAPSYRNAQFIVQ